MHWGWGRKGTTRVTGQGQQLIQASICIGENAAERLFLCFLSYTHTRFSTALFIQMYSLLLSVLCIGSPLKTDGKDTCPSDQWVNLVLKACRIIKWDIVLNNVLSLITQLVGAALGQLGTRTVGTT